MAKPSKKVLISALAVFILGGGGGAYYYVTQPAAKAAAKEEAGKETTSQGAEKEASSKHLLLNRTAVSVPLIEKNGKMYVSLTDLAPLLDGKLNTDNHTYTLQLSKPVTYTEEEGLLQNKKLYIPMESVSKFGGIYYDMGDGQYVDYALKRVERIGEYQQGQISRPYASLAAYEEAAKALLALPDQELLKKPAIVYYRYEELPKGGKRSHYGTYLPVQVRGMTFLLSVSADAVWNKGKWKATYHAMSWQRGTGGELSPVDGEWSGLQFTEDVPKLPIDTIVKEMGRTEQKEEKKAES
ncbi:hypothetical protein [Ectobacillus ponti]|uniref:Uncharacterized protein n=1 Tax=Ectobacillus ponti TaxID=2961894 RepID=A0AA41X7X1_9BACI|nr:hypothetical protein [Ectobacillus ponti]MCP8970442.1 hypothetical protein [Ectobacillus ponti]